MIKVSDTASKKIIEMMKGADVNGDDKISKEEFLRVVDEGRKMSSRRLM